MPLPRRRPLDAYPIELKEEPFFVLRDTEGLLEDPMVLDPFSFLVWNLLTGEGEVADLQAEIAKYADGVQVPAERLKSIIHQLDLHLLLESPAVEAKRLAIASAFRATKIRPAMFAGRGGYPDSVPALEKELDGYYSDQLGAGLPERSKRAALPRGILSPHIDFKRGGTCYTHAYRPVAEAAPPETCLVLGVAHLTPPSPYILSDKGYDTPFGAIEPDLDFIAAFRKRAPKGLDDHEVVHRSEHSIEFQAVFLRHAHRDGDLRIVPILCSSFEPVPSDKSPADVAQVEETIGALAETVRSSGRRILIVAGVDFAHVGPRFGDDAPLDEKLIKWMTAEDSQSLRHIVAGDAEGFWGSVTADGNKRHVCGLTATYTALRLLKGAGGSLKRYGFAPDPAGGIVSFASAVFT